MSFEEPEQLCLKGSLILADPSLKDPGFERSVLLLTNHQQDDGAAGFILNKPMGKKVSDLIQIDEMRELGDLPVFLGGMSHDHSLSIHLFQTSSDFIAGYHFIIEKIAPIP